MSKTRKISEAQAIHIRDLVVAELTRRYGPKDDRGGRSVGQRQICDEVGISQPVLMDIENATGSVGVHALVAIRNWLGRYTIDDLLMLDPLPAPAKPPKPPEPPYLDAIRAALRAELEDIRRPSPSSEPPASLPPKKGSSDAPRPRRR